MNRVVPASSAVDSVPPSFGMRLRRLRIERGLRQRDLAGDHISASYISFLEADRRVPTERVVRLLCERLGCHLEDLWLPTEIIARNSATASAVELKLARASLTVGHSDEAEAWYLRILSEHDGGDIAREAEYGLARVAELTDRCAEAAQRYEQCLAAAEDQTYAHWLGATLGLVRCLARSDEAERAIATATHAQQQISEVGLDVSDVALEIRAVLATVLCERGEYGTARKLIAEALEIVPEISDHRVLMDVYWQASVEAYRAGRMGRALEFADRITDIGVKDYGHTLGMLRAVYGSLLLRQSPPDPEMARDMLEKAISDLEASTADAVRCRNDLIRALIMLGHLVEAQRLAEEVLANAGILPAERVRARLLCAIAQWLLGDMDNARISCEQAQAELEGFPSSPRTSRLWSQLGEAMTQVGDTENAIGAYRRAISGLGVELPPTLLPSVTRSTPAAIGVAPSPRSAANAKGGRRRGSRPSNA